MTRAFTNTLRDPDNGRPRAVSILVTGAGLFVALAPSRPAGEDSPHSATADFTPQRGAIVQALEEAAEEQAEAERPYVCPEPMCNATGGKPHVRGCIEGEIEARANGDDEPDDDAPNSYDGTEGDDDE